jgi:hypothetical protein
MGELPVQSEIALPSISRGHVVHTVKWVASVIQVLGYAATAFGVTPWNLYLFVVGVVGWFAVGVLWNDRAIMLIHIIAFGAMVTGMAGK